MIQDTARHTSFCRLADVNTSLAISIGERIDQHIRPRAPVVREITRLSPMHNRQLRLSFPSPITMNLNINNPSL